MSTSSKDVLEKIKDLQEQVKNLEREVQQLKTEGDKTLSQETVSKVPIVNRSSNYVGVSWHKKNKMWKAQTTIDGKRKTLGYSRNEEEAARMYDKEAAIHGRPVNFPQHMDIEQEVNSAYYRKNVSKVSNVNLKSKYVGVVWNKETNKWKAYITINGKRKHLGYYDNEEDAALAYDDHAGLHGKPVNFPLNNGMEQAVKRVLNRSKKSNKKTSPEDIDGSNSQADPEPKRQKTDG